MPEQQVSAAAEFTVVIEGPAVSKTYPLVSVSSILLDATTILRDSAIEIISPSVEEVQIDLEAGFPREGSYVQDVILKVVEFVNQETAPLIPITLAIPITDIVKHVNETLDLAERFRKFWRQHKRPHVERVEKDALVVGADNAELAVPQKSLKDIETTLRILSELDQGRLGSVEIRTPDSTEIKIKYQPTLPFSREELRQLSITLRRLTREAKYGGSIMLAVDNVAALPPADQPTVTLRGQIRELDLDARTGRLRVLDGSSIPEETYTFELVGQKSLTDIKSLLGESTVIVDCVITGRGKKRRLMVLSVRRPR
jgi:hypothetical protein